MMGGTPVFAETYVIPYDYEGHHESKYSSGNVVIVDNTEAVISNRTIHLLLSRKSAKGMAGKVFMDIKAVRRRHPEIP